jgi:hypothetical protein
MGHLRFLPPTSVQQFEERLNDLNRYLLYFTEDDPKQFDQDEIIEILEQSKAWYPEWHGAIFNVKIEICEKSHEESVSYFKRLENLENIRETNNPNPSTLPVDNEKQKSVTSSVDKTSKNHKASKMWYCSMLRGQSQFMIYFRLFL